MEWNTENRIYREYRRDGEDENIKPVELVNHVVPLEWRCGLLVLQRPRDIVVGEVNVDGGGRVLALRDGRRGGGSFCHLRWRDGGHGGRGETGEENGDIAVGLLNDVRSLGRTKLKMLPQRRITCITT